MAACPITCLLPSAVAATRHDEADFPLAEGGPKARASQRAMPLWFAPIARAGGGGRLYVETYAAAPRRSTYGSIRTIHRNRRYEREERRLSHDAAEKKNTKGRGGGITAIQAATDLGGHSKAATCCWSLSLTLTG